MKRETKKKRKEKRCFLVNNIEEKKHWKYNERKLLLFSSCLSSFGFFLGGSGRQHLDQFLGVDFVLGVDDHRFEGIVDFLWREFVSPGHEGVSEAFTIDVAFSIVERFESVDDDIILIGTFTIQTNMALISPSASRAIYRQPSPLQPPTTAPMIQPFPNSMRFYGNCPRQLICVNTPESFHSFPIPMDIHLGNNVRVAVEDNYLRTVSRRTWSTTWWSWWVQVRRWSSRRVPSRERCDPARRKWRADRSCWGCHPCRDPSAGIPPWIRPLASDWTSRRHCCPNVGLPASSSIPLKPWSKTAPPQYTIHMMIIFLIIMIIKK